MVDINNYLNRYTLLHKPKYNRLRVVVDSFPKVIKDKYNSRFIEIYSTSIFPRRIKMNGEQYIIIDHHFGNLFAHYSLAYLCEVGRINANPDNEYLRHIMKSIILLSLASLQEELPSLALSFAQEYVDCGALLGRYDSLLNLLGKDDVLNEVELFSNMFTILHEIGHLRYNDFQESENGVLGFRKMLKKAVEFDGVGCSEDIINMIMALKAEDKPNVEELYCDLVAVLEITDVIEKVFGANMSSREKTIITIEAIMLSVGFQALLMQNTLYWQLLYYRKKKLNEKAEKIQEIIQKKFNQMQIRGSFIYTLANGIICKKHKMNYSDSYFLRSSAFDDVSFEMFQLYAERILSRALWFEQTYSTEVMKETRNNLLKWS